MSLLSLYSQEEVEKKLSQLILDGELRGILDQGKGHLIVFDEEEENLCLDKSVNIISNMDSVLSELFNKSKVKLN